MKSEVLCGCGCNEYTEIAKKTDSRRGHVKGQAMPYINGHASNNGPKRPTSDVAAAPEDPAAKEITERDIATLREVDDYQAAEIYDARVRYLEGFHKRTFVEIGLILVEVEERTLWNKIIDRKTGTYFTGFDRWLMDAAPVSRSTGYDAKGAIAKLREVPVADLQAMPRCNVKTLASLSTKVQQQPDIIEAAKTLTEQQFIAKVETKHPEQHVAAKRPMRLKPEKEARKAIDIGLEIAMWAYDVPNREEALEAMVQTWLDMPCEVEEYSHLTNRLAYDAKKDRAA